MLPSPKPSIKYQASTTDTKDRPALSVPQPLSHHIISNRVNKPIASRKNHGNRHYCSESVLEMLCKLLQESTHESCARFLSEVRHQASTVDEKDRPALSLLQL